MNRFLLCTSLPLHAQIVDFACDPQPLKASVGLFHTTDLCSQSRCLKHDGHTSFTSKPDGGEKREILKYFKMFNYHYIFDDTSKAKLKG